MKTTRILLVLLCISKMIAAQNAVTFEVENLSPPSNLLKVDALDNIITEIQADEMTYHPRRGEDTLKLSGSIVAHSTLPDSLVNYGTHPFFNGMYQAYADHRPFVMLPDMVWLLICQGFSAHVAANKEQLRHMFVDFDEGKLSLIVRDDRIRLDDPNSPWEEVFPEFKKKIASFTGNDIINTLSADFSTSTPVEKAVADITIMKTFEHYFEYIVISIMCGIPQITLEGTTADWEHLRDKANALRKYQLDWWIDELDPLLKQFVRASKGKVDKDFWMNMFKYHTKDEYGKPKIVDGWILKFFPYDKDGNKTGFKSFQMIQASDCPFPSEIVKVDIKHISSGAGPEIETPLEAWAGFMGLEQDANTFALRPKMGWLIRRKEQDTYIKEQILKSADAENNIWGGINIRCKEIPQEIIDLPQIYKLTVEFTGKIHIPNEFKFKHIGNIEIMNQAYKQLIDSIDKLPNEVTREYYDDEEKYHKLYTLKCPEMDSIAKEFPNIQFTFGKFQEYNQTTSEYDILSEYNVDDIKKKDHIWALLIYNSSPGTVLKNLKQLVGIKIDEMSLVDKTDKKTIDQIIEMFPNTKLYYELEEDNKIKPWSKHTRVYIPPARK